MICGSCRRRCDPTRSFCTNCGSSVFIDERDARSFFGETLARVSQSSPVAEQVRTLQQSAQSFDRATVAKAAKALRSGKRTARRASQAAQASSPLRVAPLFKVAIFAFLIWYAVGWLRTIPEVLFLKDRVQAGHISDQDLQMALNAIGERIQTFLRNAQNPNPPSAPAEKAPEPPPARARETPPAPPPDDSPAAYLLPPPDYGTQPPGVSLPGNGVTMPRVLSLVEPKYTPEARRAKVEGTVVLLAVIRTHGAAANIEVERSLDKQYGLDQQAIEAVRQWRFAPGQKDGRPVPVLVQIEIPFALK
jgi:TonB family protein